MSTIDCQLRLVLNENNYIYKEFTKTINGTNQTTGKALISQNVEIK